MERHKIIPATPEHVDHICARIRKPDLDELWATCMQKPITALQSGLKHSEVAMTAVVDDVPICVWGVVRESIMLNVGTPWMVGSRDLDKEAVRFIRYCRDPVMKLFDNYDILENYVDSRNTRSIRWLKWLGFTIDDPKPYGVFNLPFHRFWMTREVQNV